MCSLRSIQIKENDFLKKYNVRSDLKIETYINNKIPQKVNVSLNNAFKKSFILILDKGKIKSNPIKSVNDINQKNLRISMIKGIGFGVFGIGIADIPIFITHLLNSIYEISNYHGFTHLDEEEKIFILKSIIAALKYDKELVYANIEINRFILTGEFIDNSDYQNLSDEVAKLLAKQLTTIKFIQGIPIFGMVGGAIDTLVTKRILEYVEIKYAYREIMQKKTG